jgi:hypothetical protein
MRFITRLFEDVRRGEMAATFLLLELLAGAALLAMVVFWLTD